MLLLNALFIMSMQKVFLNTVLLVFLCSGCFASDSSRDYLLEFEFPSSESRFLEPYADLFDSAEEEPEEEFYYDYQLDQEDEYNIDDLSYVEYVNQKLLLRDEENFMDSFGVKFRNLNKKLIVMNSIRESVVFYEQLKVF